DAQHAVSSAFQFVNVPTGVWIDEQGRIVRPGESAWTSDRTDTYGGKELVIHGDAYVGALRDWVANGDRSPYVLSDEEFAKRVTPWLDEGSVRGHADRSGGVTHGAPGEAGRGLTAGERGGDTTSGCPAGD